jgi:hypothetical protein
MSKAIMTRVRKLEAIQGAYTPPRICYVRSPEGMTDDEIEAHRQEVRQAAAHPDAVLVVYQNMDGSDSLTDLFGHREAQEIRHIFSLRGMRQ